MRRLLAVSALGILAVGLTGPLAAQRRDRGIVELAAPSLRGGFYLAGGIGGGREQYKFSDEPDFTDPLTKPTLTLRLGGTPDPYVRVGAELFAWSAETSEGRETFGALLGTIQFYPMRDGGLWLKAGGGWAGSGFSPIDYNEYTVDESASPGRSAPATSSSSRPIVAIGPSVELYQGSFTRRDEPTLTERVLNIGGQVTFQTGGRRR